MKAPMKPFAWVEVAPSVRTPLVLKEMVAEPPTMVPPRGPLATMRRFSGSLQRVPGGTSS